MRDGVFCNAKWLWHELPCINLVNSFMQARRVFSCSRVPRTVEICVTADAHYRLWVNGKYLARGPARAFLTLVN